MLKEKKKKKKKKKITKCGKSVTLNFNQKLWLRDSSPSDTKQMTKKKA